MNKYQDKWTRYHHKPTGELHHSSSGNGWIYTAYSVKAGLPVNTILLQECYDLCSIDGILVRNPNQPTSPISRDEILGMAALGVLNPNHMKGWNFSPYPLPKFSLIKLTKQLLEAKGKHRNYFWENNLDQMYHVAFSVPLTDRHFILQNRGEFNLFYWAIAKVDSLIGKPSGIRYLKYGKSKEAMQEEFPEDHPLRTHNV